MKKNDYPVCKSKELSMPEWVFPFLEQKMILDSSEKRMDFLARIAEENIRKRTGGPFSAAVFDMKKGDLISIGLNQVTSETTSVAHAEIMALLFAQKKVNHFRLDRGEYELVSLAQPCAMCYGALFWSGIRRLVYGARKEDVEKYAGFDEGPLPDNWIVQLNKRGIEVISDVGRDMAIRILKQYGQEGGLLY